MFKKIALFLLILCMSITMFACNKEVDIPLDKNLASLFPEENFKWAYKGNDDYYHEMMLESIKSDEKEMIYKIVGEVRKPANISGNYTIELFYKIVGNSVIQVRNADMMIDSEYNNITLIKSPLEVGTMWQDVVKDKDGNKAHIEAKITEIKNDPKGKIYNVVYVNSKTGYSEVRQIMEHYGVIAFVKVLNMNGMDIEQGYGLYGEGSGYVEPIAKKNTEEKEPKEEENAIKDTTEIDYAEDEKNIKIALEEFNNSWIDYVNKGDETFFSYCVKNGEAYQNGKKFDRDGLKEEFVRMEINKIKVNKNTASAIVHEEIKKIKDDVVTIAKYDWKYFLKKIDGSWLIDGYE